MDDKIIATFCLCDDLLKAMHHQENRQGQMNDAEIMTTALIASLFFRGNHESARAMLQQLTFRTLFSGSMMVFEECFLAKRGMVL